MVIRLLSVIAAIAFALAVCGLLPDGRQSTLPPLELGYGDEVDLGWLSGPWTGNEQPYQKIRASLEAKRENVSYLTRVFSDYRRAALAKPSDPVTQYAWAYSAYLLARKIPTLHYRPNTWLNGVMPAMASARPPRTFEYARLAYIILQYASPSARLWPLGKRLLKHDSNDQILKLLVSKDYCDSHNLADIQYGVKLTEELVLAQPSEPKFHYALGYTLINLWLATEKRADVDRALAEYREYLRLAPGNDPYRENARFMIDQTNKILAKNNRPDARR